jgi:hypothetical protein
MSLGKVACVRAAAKPKAGAEASETPIRTHSSLPILITPQDIAMVISDTSAPRLDQMKGVGVNSRPKLQAPAYRRLKLDAHLAAQRSRDGCPEHVRTRRKKQNDNDKKYMIKNSH